VVSLRNDSLPVGHAARPVVRWALSASVLNAVLFTAFAYITTQVKVVRHTSPWQDDPYDTVVTFTMFFVPIVATLIAVRMLLCRRAQPLPVHRVAQLLRAAVVSGLLISATYATDWVAVAEHAERSRWNDRTPGLIAALGVVSVVMALTWALLARTRGLLPRPADDQAPGDWIEDAQLLVDLVAARLPRPAGRFAAWLDRSGAVGWIRRQATLVVAAGSVFAGLMVAAALAKENGFGALFFSEAVWFGGGMYAFGMIANAVLGLTAPQPRGRLRQALHVAVIAGAAALPVSLGLRGTILKAGGMSATQLTIGSLTALTFSSALLTGVVVFAGMMTRSRRS
jgi:hypothetical protein